jgi:beta-lactamase superfamily II metal-dependent hydrolase
MPDNVVVVYDCNITDENEADVFAYMKRVMPQESIGVFVNSHRDADHMRGIKKLHKRYPISTLYDSGVSANTETPEYEEYMDFRLNVANMYEVSGGMYMQQYPYVRILNGKREGLDDPNAQSIVMHVDWQGSSLLLAGDTDVDSWASYIMKESKDTIMSLVLMASHHGSLTFFNNDPAYEDYVAHLAAINPAITIISVSETNPHGHPDKTALKYYEQYSYGTVDKTMKIFRTDVHGHMKLELKGQGTGTIYWQQ